MTIVADASCFVVASVGGGNQKHCMNIIVICFSHCHEMLASHLLSLAITVKLEVTLTSENFLASFLLRVKNYAIVLEGVGVSKPTIDSNGMLVEYCDGRVISTFEQR